MTLTETELEASPYAYTQITQKMIQQSGARSLNEALEIYVPNFQKTQSAGVLGLRGNYTRTISLGFQYMLMMVNGHARDSAQTGSRFEYDLIALEDINNIEVIRSAGSATFGTVHHVMGLFDDKYNKAIRQTQSVYMTLEPSLSFTFSYSF